MSELQYTVGVTLPNDEKAAAWVDWLRNGHIREVLDGGATATQIIRLDGEPNSFEVIYRFPSREAFAVYERDHAPRLRAEGVNLFPPDQGVKYRRSTGEIIGEFAR